MSQLFISDFIEQPLDLCRGQIAPEKTTTGPTGDNEQALHAVAVKLEKPLTLSLDQAQELTSDPSVTLSPATRTARNEETSLTHASLEQEAASKAASETWENTPVPSAASAEKTQTASSVAAAQGESPVAEESIVIESDGTAVQSCEMPAEYVHAMSAFKPGLLLEGSHTLEGLQALKERLEGLMGRLESDIRPENTLVMATVLGSLEQVENRIASRVHLDEMTQVLDDLCRQAGKTPAEKLQLINTTFHAVWRHSQLQTMALGILEDGDPAARPAAAALLRGGLGIVGEDAATLERTLKDAMTDQLKLLSIGSGLEDDALRDLAALSLKGQFDAGAMLETITSAPQWTSEAYRSDLVSVLAQGVQDTLTLEGETDAAQRSQRLDYVDMLFQGSYPESADAALDLKKMLLPGHAREAELQHALRMTGRQLLTDILAPGQPPTGRGRTAALGRTASSSSSLRSFVLTPDIVRALTHKVALKDFNFHLAHVALLQKRCVETGILRVDDETVLKMRDMKGWCEKLGLDKEAASYAASLDLEMLQGDENADRHTRRLLGACAEFVRGLRGTTEQDAAGKILFKTSNLTGTLRAEYHETKLYESSPDYLARLALDRHIISLSGLIRPEERFVEGATGLEPDGDTVDTAIRDKTGAFLSGVAARSPLSKATVSDISIEEFTDEVSASASARTDLLREMSRFRTNADRMQAFARAVDEKLEFIDARTGFHGEREAMKAERGTVRFSWLHQRHDRHRVSDEVLNIARLAHDLDSLPEALPENAPKRHEIQEQITQGLEFLRGVDVFRLTHSRKADTEAPSLEMVLEHMLPRARALDYFRIRRHQGVPMSEATASLLKMKKLSMQIHKKDRSLDLKSLRWFRHLGKDNMRRVQDTVTAAILKTFVESGEDIADFSVRDEAVQNNVFAQLQNWGVDVENDFLHSIILLSASRLTKNTGRLDASVLKDLATNTKMRYEAKESLAKRRQSLRGEGLSRLKARGKTHDFIKHDMLEDDRRRAAGIRSLMRGASMPGSGFVYDRSRGVVVNTGSVFSPTSTQNSLITKTNIKHPLSLRFQKLHSNSLTVSNMGGGSFQVMLKGTDIGSLGAKMNIPAGQLTAFMDVSGGGSKERGLALTFVSQQDCEAFLTEFMNKNSDLHQTGEKAKASWRRATEMRFVDGSSVSANLTAGVMSTLFAQKLSAKTAVSLSAAASLSLGGEIKRTTEHGMHGETTVLSRKGHIMVTASLSAALTKGSTLYGSPKLGKATASKVDIDQRFKVVTGEKGIMPSTCVETECSRGTLTAHGIRHLMLPAVVTDRIKNDAVWSDALDNALNNLPPTARVVIHRSLKPEVLTQARQLMVDARNAPTQEEGRQALAKAHDLLATFDSYTPDRIIIKNVGQQTLGRGWSPGVAMLQCARKATITHFGAKPVITIDLPQAEA